MAKKNAPQRKVRRFAGFDIGGTKLYCVITDENGKVLGKGRKKTKPEGGFKGVMERVRKTLNEACKDADVKFEDLEAIGLGSPSPIMADGTAVFAPNLGWRNVPLSKTVSKMTGRPVFAENDVNAGTFGEYMLGAGKGAKTLVGLFPGTGLGGGIVYHGELIRGENRMAAELGHVVVQVDGRPCGCGHLGCLESYASKTGMGKRFTQEIVEKKRDSMLTKECKGNYGNVKSSILARAYKAKDKVVTEALHEAARYLGIGVGNMVTILGPDTVVLGGGVFEALGKELIGLVRKAAKTSTLPEESLKDTKIVLAKLGDDAVALGAMMYARSCVVAAK